MIWAVTASANALDPDLENAAANCGAPPVQTFCTVTLPAVMPGVITGSLLMFILALNEFLVSLLLVDARIVTLPVQIYNSIRSIITPDLAAISVVFVAVAGLAIVAARPPRRPRHLPQIEVNGSCRWREPCNFHELAKLSRGASARRC